MNGNVTGKGADTVPKKTINEKFCQKKTIDIFTYKQRILSKNMKTKVVPHVKRERVNERLKECESESVRESV